MRTNWTSYNPNIKHAQSCKSLYFKVFRMLLKIHYAQKTTNVHNLLIMEHRLISLDIKTALSRVES